MNKLTIYSETIKPKDHRYPTSGDWLWDKDTLLIRVSPQTSWKHAVLLTVHEIIEAVLCRSKGITDQAVTKFDMSHSKLPKRGNKEPGDHPKSPYRRQHQAAQKLEKLLAQELGVDWKRYEKGLK